MNYSEIQNYKGLIFDLDGTLINSMPYHALAWKQVATEHGFDIDIKDIYAMGGSASRDIAAYYNGDGGATKPSRDCQGVKAYQCCINPGELIETQDYVERVVGYYNGQN